MISISMHAWCNLLISRRCWILTRRDSNTCRWLRRISVVQQRPRFCILFNVCCKCTYCSKPSGCSVYEFIVFVLFPNAQICGSLHYVSPEILRRSYSFPADMWALGVLVFVMLFGRYPFIGSSTFHTCRSILQGTIKSATSHVALYITHRHTARCLLRMHMDQSRRITRRTACFHPFTNACANAHMLHQFPN